MLFEVKSAGKSFASIVTLAVVAAPLAGSIGMEMQKIENSEKSGSAQSPQTCCPIVELRQYTLHPGMRDTLIELFDREFVETQEALGMKIIGQFRDMDNSNRFVWLRGFHDMPSRADALKSFYSGLVWKAHGKAANATMIDSDNVLLLRPARATSGFLTRKQRTSSGWHSRNS
jgi:hypothetical protein